jgi:phosphinothricin acetyltransferase
MIHPAQPEHLEAINEIYNQAVEDEQCTAHIKPFSYKERKTWFAKHSEDQFPVFVYINDESEVIGWISLSPYRSDRQALKDIVEINYYVDYDHHDEGIATELMTRALQFCKESDYRIAVAILISSNEPSIHLLKKFGFIEGGRIPNALHFEEEFQDHLYMYKNLAN